MEKMLQSLKLLCGPVCVLFQQVHVFLTLGSPELQSAYQVLHREKIDLPDCGGCWLSLQRGSTAFSWSACCLLESRPFPQEPSHGPSWAICSLYLLVAGLFFPGCRNFQISLFNFMWFLSFQILWQVSSVLYERQQNFLIFQALHPSFFVSKCVEGVDGSLFPQCRYKNKKVIQEDDQPNISQENCWRITGINLLRVNHASPI